MNFPNFSHFQDYFPNFTDELSQFCSLFLMFHPRIGEDIFSFRSHPLFPNYGAGSELSLKENESPGPCARLYRCRPLLSVGESHQFCIGKENVRNPPNGHSTGQWYAQKVDTIEQHTCTGHVLHMMWRTNIFACQSVTMSRDDILVINQYTAYSRNMQCCRQPAGGHI